MPIPAAAVAAGAAAASNQLGTALNFWQTNRQNRLSRDFSREMYGRQYNDNIRFWEMQNAYNDPKAQMQRLRDAGLNPAMIYGGQGSGAAGQSGPLHSPSAMSARFEPADFSNLGRIVSDYQQAELMVKQGSMMDAQTLLTLEKAALTGSQTESTDFKRKMDMDLETVSKDLKRETLQNIKTRNRFLLTQEERNAAMHEKRISEAIERIAKIRMERKDILPARKRQIEKQIEVMQQDKMIKYYEKRLRAKGLSFNDPRIWRMIATVTDKIMEGGKLSPGVRKIWDQTIDELFKNL